MAMKMFRCLQCNREFEAEKPACVECGVDSQKDPADRGIVQEIAMIHFDPPSRRPGQGLGYAACDSKKKIGTPKCQFTGEPTAVTCKACQESEAFKAADGMSNGPAAMKVGKLETKAK